MFARTDADFHHPRPPPLKRRGLSGCAELLPLLFRGGGRGVVLAAAAALCLPHTGSATAQETLADNRDTQMHAEWAAQCEDWDEWDKTGPPFLVHGNTWSVGTCGISVLLVTDRQSTRLNSSH